LILRLSTYDTITFFLPNLWGLVYLFTTIRFQLIIIWDLETATLGDNNFETSFHFFVNITLLLTLDDGWKV
jgi:hypothetical protein